jgi:hypothetical protein
MLRVPFLNKSVIDNDIKFMKYLHLFLWMLTLNIINIKEIPKI